MTSPLLRFAPSPNGRLHLGHAYSALLNDRMARRLGGSWLLRMEDIDPTRATPGRVTGIEDDLSWLGLAWPEPVRRQSEHFGLYLEGGARLRAAGLLYPCFCTRGEIGARVACLEAGGTPWPCDPDETPLYPGTCRRLEPAEVHDRIGRGAPHAWRLDTRRATAGIGRPQWRRFVPDEPDEIVEARPERWGDVALVRKDVPTSYHLAVVMDDAEQGITHVVRGRDLEAATDLHALLAARLGLVLPRYHHHDLLRGPDGEKLAKSRDSVSLAAMREAGETAETIRARLGFT